MLDLAKEVTGKRELPGFSKNVIFDDEVTCYLHPLHELVIKGSCEFGKEEKLLLLISLLIRQYGQTSPSRIPECREEIEKACDFMEQHFADRIYLDQICRHAGLSKATLLRAFTVTYFWRKNPQRRNRRMRGTTWRQETVFAVVRLCGVCLISFNGAKIQLNPIGDLLALAAVVVWA